VQACVHFDLSFGKLGTGSTPIGARDENAGDFGVISSTSPFPLCEVATTLIQDLLDPI
jgi:hypothetical protein